MGKFKSKVPTMSPDDFIALPLSERLLIAVRDAKRASKLKNVELDMREFHFYDESQGKCSMCMAGAVFDLTIEGGKSRKIHLSGGEYGRAFDRAIWTIDTMRRGNLPEFGSKGGYISLNVKEKFELMISETYNVVLGRAKWSTYIKAAEYLKSIGL